MGDVPQATLARIRDVVRAVTARVHDTKAVAESSGTPYRHAQYAIAAARVLGLVTGPADHLKLTANGRTLADSAPDSKPEAEVLIKAISASPQIQKIAPGLMGSEPPSVKDTASRIQKEAGYSPKTATQRARMIHKWRRDLLQPRQQRLDLPRPPKRPVTRQRASAQDSVPHRTNGELEETIDISAGSLGPIPPCTLRIRPFTVFVGPQGSGKSLLAQVLYFFRALRELIPAEVAAPRRGEAELSPESLVRRVLDGLRSPQRALAVFADKSVTMRWTAEGSEQPTLGLGMYSWNRRIRPDRHLDHYVTELIRTFRELKSRAIFIPTERLYYSAVRSPLATSLLSLPNTYVWFSEWMQRATAVFESWKDGGPDTPKGRWIQERAREALRGEAYRWRDTWKWRFPRHGKSADAGVLDLDMASSGQRATWPIVLLAETLSNMRKRGRLHDTFTLYVEEPEIHLHPEAQVAVVEILAYLVRQGFRVVVTTHSLTVLYALNNLVLAGGLTGKRGNAEGLPPEEASLTKKQVAAYALGEKDPPKDLVDPDTGFISEAELGRVNELLNATMNRLTARLFTTGEAAPK